MSLRRYFLVEKTAETYEFCDIQTLDIGLLGIPPVSPLLRHLTLMGKMPSSEGAGKRGEAERTVRFRDNI